MSLVGQALSNLKNNLTGNFSAVQPLGKPVQAAPVAPISQGVTSKPVPTVAPTKKTTLSTSQKSTYSPSFSASTLAQQKSLNAQGAGLKEDGIMGPLTQAAISKYSQPTPVAPVNTQQNTVPEAQNAPVSAPIRETDTTYQGLLRQAVEQANRAADFQNMLDQKSNDLTKQGIAMESVQGQQATLQRGYGAQAQAEASKANALANLASINRPTSVGYDVRYGSPTDLASGTEKGSGQYGTGPGAASNVQTIKDLTTKVNNIKSQAPALTANLQNLSSYTKSINASTPIEAGLRNLYGSTLQGNQAIAGYQTQLASIRAQYEQITGASGLEAFPDNMTPQTLSQKIRAFNDNIKNIQTGYENQLNKLSNMGTSSVKTGGGMFGSFF